MRFSNNCFFCQTPLNHIILKSLTTTTSYCDNRLCNYSFSANTNKINLISFKFTINTFHVFVSCGYPSNTDNHIFIYVPNKMDEWENIITIPYSPDYFQDFPALHKIYKLFNLIPFS